MATITQTQLEIKLQPPSTSRFIHPRLTVGFSPSAGRMVASTGSVKAGDVLMIDQPYALVPAMAPDQPLFAICSSHTCNRRIPSESEMVYCAHGCVEEVAWCNEECRLRDERFHAAECSWLREMAGGMRAEYDDADFGVIWLIARCLIRKQLEYDGKQVANHVSHFDRRGWNAVWNLDGPIPSAKEKHWETIFDKYFTAMAKGLAGSVKEAMDLLWKVENNSFGLYPGTTGEYPVASFVSRGEYYGGGVWPTAAMFNHSCCPNVTHRLDTHGNRIFEATRDIQDGEECCISYFDLFEFRDLEARRGLVRGNWNFECGCKRCTEEGEFDFPDYLKEMDFDV